MGALCEDLSDLALDSFHHTALLIHRHVLHLFFNSCLHLDSVLSLLAYCNFMTSCHYSLDVVLEMGFVEADDVLPLTRWDAQVQVPVADIRVLVVNDKPMPKSVENYLVEVFRFDLPVADHARSQPVPLGLRNVQSAWVVVWVVRPALILVENVVWLSEPRAFFILLDYTVHILPRYALPFIRIIAFFTTVFHCIDQLSLCHRLPDSQNSNSILIRRHTWAEDSGTT